MRSAVIREKRNAVKDIYTSDYSVAKVYKAYPTVKINEVLPFRIKITTLGIESYGPNNPAPIGIAIIGLNNYVL